MKKLQTLFLAFVFGFFLATAGARACLAQEVPDARADTTISVSDWPVEALDIRNINGVYVMGLNKLGRISTGTGIDAAWNQALACTGSDMDVNDVKWYTALAIFSADPGRFPQLWYGIAYVYNQERYPGEKPEIIIAYLGSSPEEALETIYHEALHVILDARETDPEFQRCLAEWGIRRELMQPGGYW
jgi:hypothetical protein